MNAMLKPRLDTEIIDKLFLELSQFTTAKTARDIQLEKLLYAVEKKYPNETRFETALRYIQNAEHGDDTVGCGDTTKCVVNEPT
jgi:hypothetical protein